MEQFYLPIVVFLVLLSAVQLFIGISNDAVNFLSAGVGSKIAPFKIILLCASAGILIGATFSSGMMEIARCGMFNPEYLCFSDVIVIFFSVMITDIILLDIFVSLGLPTSSTVSIIFELLGASVLVVVYKLMETGQLTVEQLANRINSEKALAIIAGIFLSVVIAFTIGAIVQFLLRLTFTFDLGKVYKKIGSVFGGLCVTAILYFLIIKGLSGASFMKTEWVLFMNEHTVAILLCTFVVITLVFQLLISLNNINIFKIVILLGTFALAFAFAGNDLVNFIGVPLAAVDSYTEFSKDIYPSTEFMMNCLLGSAKTPTLYLLLAGIVMVLTMCFSKKSRKNIQTSINLSSSNRGAKEQFGSSPLGRLLVRGSLKFNKFLHNIFPESFFDFVNRRMVKLTYKRGEQVPPFDHLRASVNLVVSSILIATATSMKLPLSTTYITFMVAMGSSLADGAWDRESAVYRISGVLTVVSGWFLTAFIAFTLCGLIALLVIYGGIVSYIIFGILIVAMEVRSNFFAKKKEGSTFEKLESVDKFIIRDVMKESLGRYLDVVTEIYKNCIIYFLKEDLSSLREVKNTAISLHDEITERRAEYYQMALEKNETKEDRDAKHFYYRIYTNLKELGHGLRSTVGSSFNHIDNNHRVFKGKLGENLLSMIEDLRKLSFYILDYIRADNASDTELAERVHESITLINQYQMELLQSIDSDDISLRGSELYLNLLQFSRDLVNRFSLIAVLQHELNIRCLPEHKLKLAEVEEE
ncbi:MAG TPA: inorganic phosphate transporter [Porphyromonadaceae bacterium]|nr:inorganic phosphate transporter [Porphyromonadaceae bacterium]